MAFSGQWWYGKKQTKKNCCCSAYHGTLTQSHFTSQGPKQTNGRLHIVLRDNAKISEMFHEKKQKLSACRPSSLKGHRTGGWQAGQKWNKIANLVLEKLQQQKHLHGLKKESKSLGWQTVEPRCYHFLVLFTLRLCPLVSSTYVLQKQMRGKERERNRETSVGSYCV